MEPRIQYAKTKDGVSIAFWTLGEGMPLVHAPLPGFSHIQMEWQIPEIRHFYESLAAKRKLIRFDRPGFGLSQRDVADHSLDASLTYLETLVDPSTYRDSLSSRPPTLGRWPSPTRPAILSGCRT